MIRMFSPPPVKVPFTNTSETVNIYPESKPIILIKHVTANKTN